MIDMEGVKTHSIREVQHHNREDIHNLTELPRHNMAVTMDQQWDATIMLVSQHLLNRPTTI